MSPFSFNYKPISLKPICLALSIIFSLAPIYPATTMAQIYGNTLLIKVFFSDF